MTPKEAMIEIVKISRAGTPGKLSTVMCAAVGIPFETFLRFSQMKKEDQVIGLKKLADQFETDYNRQGPQ
jgi:hypothetical protein